ncbi:uncharacterized protein LOC144121832 [Amblyomma americanum]|uniref:Lipocal-1 1 n=1 Tax=Amblyomma americanum TaxID=6943 RepID=A0AAQ4DGV0_AMBAM
MTFAVVLSICASLLIASVTASQDLPEDNPALQVYQNIGECFPLKETLYQLYQNFESDPFFGGAGMCFRVTDTGPYVDGSTTATVQYSPDVSLDVLLTLVSTPGYEVKDVVNVQSVNDPSVTFNFTTAYTDCDSCMIFRHSYTESGKGCSYWVPESKLGVNNTCCEFIYDLLCGASPKYQVYEDCDLA